MPGSEIIEAHAIVEAVTDLLDRAQEAGEDEVLLRLHADAAAFLVAHPEAGPGGHALQLRIVRACARAAYRCGFDVTVLRLRAAPMRAWLAQRGATADAADYPGEAEDRLTGEAALRALGLGAAELKEPPRKSATGRTLAARIARWATDPEADESLIVDLTEELLDQRLDGALGIVERMLEPEDFAYARRGIDLAAASCLLGEKGRQREALLFVCPVLRDGADPRAPELPAGLQGRLTGIALDPAFVEMSLAPCWIPTAALARLKPSELREAAEALGNGLEPAIPRAAPDERDVCLLGLTLPMPPPPDDEDVPRDDAAEGRLDAWLAVIADAAGGGSAAPPLLLGRALDLLRRARLAIPDEPLDEEEEDEEPEVSAALVEALVEHLGGIGEGSVLLTGAEDGVLAFRIAEGAADIEAQTLRDALVEALLGGGVLFAVPTPKPGAKGRGHAFLLVDGDAEGMSAADAAAAFADEAPADWAASPATWQDAPALDYDPGAP